MEHEPTLPEPLRDVEGALRALVPGPGRVDRERIMFLAGRSSVSPPGRSWGRLAWPAATAASLLVSAVLGTLLVLRPDPEVVREIVYVDRPVPAANDHDGKGTNPPGGRGDNLPEPRGEQNVAADRPDDIPVQTDREPPETGRDRWGGSHYLTLRDAVLAGGADSLPVTDYAGGSKSGPSATYLRLRNDLVGEPGDDPYGLDERRSLWNTILNPGENL